MPEQDPYEKGLNHRNFYAAKLPVSGRVVAVLRGNLADRNLSLIKQPSRCVLTGEVHEILVTDEEVPPGGTVSKVGYLCFLEFLNPGVLLRGDQLIAGSGCIGRLLGFDLSHFPNHMNIVIRGALRSGEELGLKLLETVTFQSPACHEAGDELSWGA